MKSINILKFSCAALLVAGMTSCDDFLNKEPESKSSPESFFTDATHLESYANDQYNNIFSTAGQWNYGRYGWDSTTDNQIGTEAPNEFTSDLYKTYMSGGSFEFYRIYHLNFFFDNALPKYGEALDGSQNTIRGEISAIKHYIGEMYFIRAWVYYDKLLRLGDFPIITTNLEQNLETLTAAAKRSPRNEVARFILEDLDKAIYLMGDRNYQTTRINRDAAMLFKSRVALNEGTWLKYFKGTAFVPGGEGWPGASAYPNYQYPSGSIDNEIAFFLTEAANAAKDVAEKYKGQLAQNTGISQSDDPTAGANAYFNMFADEDLSKYPEVLLWRQYALGLNTNNVPVYASRGNRLAGMTRQFVYNFLMKDGTPAYTHGTEADGDGYYKGDKTLADIRVNRDDRLRLFLKEPKQKNIIYNTNSKRNTHGVIEEPYPAITNNGVEDGYVTGLTSRKGGALDGDHYGNGAGYVGDPIMRAAEALLNYMEASYELNGSLDGSAREYWQILRRRAGVSDNIDATIAATNMSKEAELDWGAWSAGQVLSDPTLYNIRRERRSEYMCEGMRWDDIKRWRSLDQLTTNAYMPEGMHLWNTPMQNWYKDNSGASTLYYEGDGSGKSAVVSGPDKSEYLRPYQRSAGTKGYSGLVWKMAHYLEPIQLKQMQLTSSDNTIGNSIIYQNPYWPTEPDQPATK